jgi:hypothetical protein
MQEDSSAKTSVEGNRIMKGRRKNLRAGKEGLEKSKGLNTEGTVGHRVGQGLLTKVGSAFYNVQGLNLFSR